jgi:hypothetical protein
MTMEWRGDADMLGRMLEYGQKVQEAVHQVAEYWAPVIETSAKQNAPWTDRTGNARQGLRGFVEDLSATSVALYLTHSVEYGIYLELNYQGRYAIIMPTLEAHYQPIKDMLDGIFR